MNIYELVFVASFLFVMSVSISIGASIGGVFGGIIGAFLGVGLLAIVYQILKQIDRVSQKELERSIREFNAERGLESTDVWSEGDVAAFKKKLEEDALKRATAPGNGSDKKT